MQVSLERGRKMNTEDEVGRVERTIRRTEWREGKRKIMHGFPSEFQRCQGTSLNGDPR